MGCIVTTTTTVFADPGDGVEEQDGLDIAEEIAGVEEDDVEGPLAPEADDDPADIVEEPSYKNPAQAHHAANLQEQALAADPDLLDQADKVADAEKEEADLLEELEKAAELYGEDSQEYKDLEEAYKEAQEETEKLQDAYADMLGERTGVLAEEIADMRQVQKMGWGQIAHYLGVHPKYLGRRLGHTKNWKGVVEEDELVDDGVIEPGEPGDIDQEIAEATRRNTRSGWSSGHGVKTRSGDATGGGLGLSKASGKSSEKVNGNKGGSKADKGNSSNGGASAASAKGKEKDTTGSGSSAKSGNSSKGGDKGKGGNSGNGNSGNNGNKGGNSNGNKGGNGKK